MRAYAREIGLLTFKLSTPANRGIPDRIFIRRDGAILFMELKRPGKQPTKLQHYVIRMLRAFGCNASWSDTVEDACRQLDKFLLS